MPHAVTHLTQSDHTLELLDERSAIAGALSIEVSGVAAMRLLLQSRRGPIAPPPPLVAGGGGDGKLLWLACGELQVWPEASRSAAQLRAGESLFLALELAVPPANHGEGEGAGAAEAGGSEDTGAGISGTCLGSGGDEGGGGEGGSGDEGGLHESDTVRLRSDRTARFDARLSLRLPAALAARQALREALSPAACLPHVEGAHRGAPQLGSPACWGWHCLRVAALPSLEVT